MICASLCLNVLTLDYMITNDLTVKDICYYGYFYVHVCIFMCIQACLEPEHFC